MSHFEPDSLCCCPSCSAAKRMKPIAVEAEPSDVGRRAFLMAGAALLLSGCAQAVNTAALPSPVWKPRELGPLDVKPVQPEVLAGNVIPRSQWAQSGAFMPLLNPMLPVRHITVHHDGMDPFYATDERGTKDRLERIRRAHRDRGWADIGYHFVVDRDGRVWQGRLLNWQGAHVKDHNEGNIGIVALGNFDRQTPSAPQIASLNRHLSLLMKQYRVPLANVKTHQEWAATACPGANLQRYMVAVRKNRQLG